LRFTPKKRHLDHEQKTETLHDHIVSTITLDRDAMATSGSYKTKVETLVHLLTRRTEEAKGWQTLAESRLRDLSFLSHHLLRLEEAVLAAPVFSALTGPLPPRTLERISDGASVRSGVSSAEDFTDTFLALLAMASGIIADGDTALTGALALASIDLSVPATSELDGQDGLSLEEMGALRLNQSPSPTESPQEAAAVAAVTTEVTSGHVPTQGRSERDLTKPRSRDKEKDGKKHRSSHH
jgi:hypothetical protein